MSTTVELIPIASDILVRLSGLRTETAAGAVTYINDATVTASLIDGVTLSNVVTGVSLTYVSASNGIYEGYIDDQSALTAGRLYITRVVAVKSGRQTTFEVTGRAAYA
jgi:hypothetical protein